MGCGTSMNSVAPLYYNQNGSVLWNNSTGSDISDYMTIEDIKLADDRATQIFDAPTSVINLTNILSKDERNQMICARSFYKWISNNIRYDPHSDSTDVTNILNTKKSSSEGCANLFEQMCRLKDITVIRIFSYVKNYGYTFNIENVKDSKNMHVWNAVLINNTYHYVDCSWAALHVQGHKTSDEDIEHFFCTSPKLVGDLC